MGKRPLNDIRRIMNWNKGSIKVYSRRANTYRLKTLENSLINFDNDMVNQTLGDQIAHGWITKFIAKHSTEDVSVSYEHNGLFDI